MTDINRVIVDVEVINCCAAEAGIEHESVLPAAAENRHTIADVVEGVALRRAAHHLEFRHVRRRISTLNSYGQRLIADVPKPITDLRRIGDGQRIASLEKIEIGVSWVVGPIQDLCPTVACHTVELDGAGGNERTYIGVRWQRR